MVLTPTLPPSAPRPPQSIWAPWVAGITPPGPPPLPGPWPVPVPEAAWPVSAVRSDALGMVSLLLRLAWHPPIGAATGPTRWWWSGADPLRLLLARELAATWGLPAVHVALDAPRGYAVLEGTVPGVAAAGGVITVADLATAPPATQQQVAALLGGAAGPWHPATLVIGLGGEQEAAPPTWRPVPPIPWPATPVDIDARWFLEHLPSAANEQCDPAWAVALTPAQATRLVTWWRAWCALGITADLPAPGPTAMLRWAWLASKRPPAVVTALVAGTLPAGTPAATCAALVALTDTALADLQADSLAAV